jgi:hypothetical protein
VRSKEEKKRMSYMKSGSEVRKEERNWSWSGERKEKSRSGMRTKKGDLESKTTVRKKKTHGEQEWSKEGKGDFESRSGVRKEKIH